MALKAEAAFKKLTRRQKLKYMSDVCDQRLEEEYEKWQSSLDPVDVISNTGMNKHDPKVEAD